MNPTRTLLLAGLGVLGTAFGGVTPAHAAGTDDAPPGVEALEAFRNPEPRRNPVTNRFFLKSRRFEITPLLGTVPNNAFSSRFTVSVNLAYHLTEQLSVQAMISFAPDLGKRDVKSLVPILLRQSSDQSFEQPLDKVTLSTAIGVGYAPVYGKINLLGETVLNFDFYGFLGIGLVTQTEYYATRSANADNAQTNDEYFDLTPSQNEVRAAPTLALGANFFLSQLVALRLDGRMLLVIDDKPAYDRDNPPPGLRAISQFQVSAGIAIFVPKMKPRITDF